MRYLRFLYLSFLFFCLFVNYSSAQEKSPSSTIEAKKFESKEGNFSINIFQEPFQIRDIEPDKKGMESGKQFFWRFEKVVFTVMYSEFNKNSLSQAFNDMNSGVRKGILRQQGKVISEKEISYGKYAGREFHSIMPNGMFYTCRNYLIGNFGYLLTAAYIDEKDEKEVFEVLDSFKLLKESK